MKNPLDFYRSNLFGSRGADIEEALRYVNELAGASGDAVAVQTAAHVLLNTCANAVAQVMNAPSPERLALMDLIDQRIEDHKLIREDAVADKITDWMSDNLESYINDNIDLDIDNKINDWMQDNLSDQIDNINLVVRVG
jgi:hypothetical protein